MIGDRRVTYRREGLVLAVAVGVIGITFGVLADAAGFDLARIVVLSTLVFTGASQFAAVGVVDGGGSAGAAVGSALLIAARNALYGPVVARALPRRILGRAVGAHFVIDETTAMASVQADDREAAGAFWFTGVTLWVCWNVGSVAGALLGAALGEPEAWGLDAAFPAGFVALLAPHVRTRPGRVAALGGATLALMTLPITPAGVPLMVGAAAVIPAVLIPGSRGGAPS
ncbi:MAG: AzlC family ABC transporter permease [Acidimicrobiales bacterium]